jgi:glycosyltransferase involved in cell wall biosynthesis
VASISAFFPCFNDEATIASVVETGRAALQRLAVPFELIVVDDGSTDRSGEVLRALANRCPELRVVVHPRNRGYGAALISGFAATRHDWIFYTDGDGQFDPAEVARLVERARPDVDLVQGFKTRRADGWTRTVVGNVYRAVAGRAFGLGVRDVNCDFRLIRASKLDSITLACTSGAICVELVHKLERSGARVVEVPVSHYPRPAGRSQFLRVRRVALTLVQAAGLWCELARTRSRTRAPGGHSRTATTATDSPKGRFRRASRRRSSEASAPNVRDSRGRSMSERGTG